MICSQFQLLIGHGSGNMFRLCESPELAEKSFGQSNARAQPVTSWQLEVNKAVN